MLRKFLHLSLFCVAVTAVQSSDIIAQDNAEYRYTAGLIHGNVAWVEPSLKEFIPTMTEHRVAVNRTESFEDIEGGQTKYINLFYPYNPIDPSSITRATIQIGATVKGSYFAINTYSLINGQDKPELSGNSMSICKGLNIPGQDKQVTTVSNSSSKKTKTRFGF